MAASIHIFSVAKQFLCDGTFDLDGNTFAVSLHSSAYVPDLGNHAVFADTTDELPTAAGYTAGGQTLTGVAWFRTLGTMTFRANAAIWNAAGGDITARYAVIRAVGTLNGHVDPLLAIILLDNAPADVTATDGNPFAVVWDAAGIFTLS